MNSQFDVIIIGGGQVGLAMGYQLRKRGSRFVILDANERVGDAWRKRWDSLRLFTPARYDNLPGMPFPAPASYFPTKDEMVDYLESYAEHFQLPVQLGVRVEKLSKNGDFFEVIGGDLHYTARNVVVAMATFQEPKMPSFASQLDPQITQFHSSEYCNPSQLQEGGVLVVGAGNSGAEIALELSRSHPTWLSGRHPGHVPFRIESLVGRVILIPLVLRLLFHRVFTIDTPIGRRERSKLLKKGGMLVRTKPEDLEKAGVQRVPRTTGVRNGLPVLDDGRSLEVKNVIWSTGYHPGFSWIDIPVMGEIEPRHRRGVVPEQPGLYFAGLHFLYAASSTMIQGADRDTDYIAGHIAARMKRFAQPAMQPEGQPDASVSA
jgi:putative flavoprotein involved in K+ transport